MTAAPRTLFGNAAASGATLFTSLAGAASLRTPPRLWTQAKIAEQLIAEQLIAANPSAAIASLYKMAQRNGLDSLRHSCFHSTALRSADGGWSA